MASVAARRRVSVPRATVWVALAGLLVATAALVLYLGRSTSFYFDEWNFVLLRRAWDADALLQPHNEHLSLVPVLIYKAIFTTAGIDSYVPFRVAGVAVHLLTLVALFVYARRRVGDVLALGAAVVIAVLGPAWPDVLWPFQMGFLGSLAAGIGALLALDRGDRRGEIGGGGPAHRRARVVLARASRSWRRGARDPRAARPPRALVDCRRPGRALRRRILGYGPARARRASTTSSPRPPTSPMLRRPPPARCSGSGVEWGRRSRSRASRCSCWRSARDVGATRGGWPR